AFTSIACDDDDGPLCWGNNASVQFAATGGTTYYILVGGYDEDSGNLSITAYVPINDVCSQAIGLSPGIAVTVNTTQAGVAGDPAPPCGEDVTKAVWFAYTPPRDGPVTISTCGSSFDTVLAVYTGDCNALSPVICDDDDGPSCSGVNASVQFN